MVTILQQLLRHSISRVLAECMLFVMVLFAANPAHAGKQFKISLVEDGRPCSMPSTRIPNGEKFINASQKHSFFFQQFYLGQLNLFHALQFQTAVTNYKRYTNSNQAIRWFFPLANISGFSFKD